VTETAIRTPSFRLVKAGASPSGYTTDLSWRPEPFTGTARVDRVLDEFERGATIVLQALHHSWLPIARYCRALEAELGHPVQANAYFTPRGSQGLPVHHDTHEVISLQVAGHKRWLVYEPVLELPLKHQRYRPSMGGPGETVLDVTLHAGDTLYLPRGWMHEALTSDADSLHLTIGVNVRPWVDAVRRLLDELENELPFRRSIDEEPDGLLELLADRLDVDAVRRDARDRLVRSRRPVLDGQLSELRALDSLTVDTPLERRQTVIADLDGTALSFEGRTLRFPERLAAELEFLVSADGPFTAADLPGPLDEEGRLVLFRRLVRAGFLRRSAAGA
jgi:Cupin superfamily protein